jgi:hypothetical protein
VINSSKVYQQLSVQHISKKCIKITEVKLPDCNSGIPLDNKNLDPLQESIIKVPLLPSLSMMLIIDKVLMDSNYG